MAVSQSGKDDLIDRLAEEIAERFRNGERPTLKEYVEHYPDLAEDIRELLPALFQLERVKDDVAQEDASPPSCSPMPASVGDYLILREVGRGGMGVVYEAQQLSLGRRVALKLLPQHMFRDTRQRLRFEREARAAARLHHTNIVPVFGVGEHDGQPYYSMQFIHGLGLDEVIDELRRLKSGGTGGVAPAGPEPSRAQRDLSAADMARSMLTGGLSSFAREATRSAQAGADNLSREPEPAPAPPANPALTPSTTRLSDIFTVSSADGPAKPDLVCSTSSSRKSSYWHCVARIGQQVADALDYAHKQGIVHRDIKPSNLLLDTREIVWVTDFGLAKLTSSAGDSAENLTHTGDLLGTLRYMPPEAFDGKSDARGDVYGLGLTLYEMLAFRPAFDERERSRLIKQVSLAEPARLERISPGIPADLATIVHKAIQGDAKDRYASAAEMAADLRRFLDDEPIQARRISAVERLYRWCYRNPMVAALGALVAVLVLAVALVSSLGLVSTRRQLHLTEQAEEQATNRLYHSLVEQARASRRSRGAGQRFASLATLDQATQLAHELHLPEDDFLELRNEVIACLALPDVRLAKEWDGWPEGTTHVDFDDQGQRYARVDRQGNISVRRVADDGEICHFPSGIGDCWPDLSPDGRFLLVREAPRAKVWELDGQEPRVIFDDESCFIGAFSPDSRQVALAHLDGSISLHDLPSGRSVRRLSAGPVPRSLAFQPNGRQLAIACQDRAQVRDLETGKVCAEFRYPAEDTPYVAWHPNGKTVATGGGDRVIRLWDVATAKQTVQLEGCKNGGIHFRFTRAGDLLASNGWEATLRLWDPRTGQQLFQVRAEGTGPNHFGPDDCLLAADIKDGKVRLWEVAASRAYHTLIRDPTLGKGRYATCAISPKGRLLAAGMRDGVGFWDCRSGAALDFVRLRNAEHVVFEAGALLTDGAGGPFRWPVRPDPAAPELLRIGPPQRLPLAETAYRELACSPEGRVVTSTHYLGALVWHRDRPGELVRLTPHKDVRSVGVSPDGRWVATGSHGGSGAKVWDAATGRLVADLVPTQSRVEVRFSPDGKWLAVSNATAGVCRLWAVDSWLEGPSLGAAMGAVAFSPDGRLLAVETGQNAVRLLDPDTGREYARLEDPNQERAWHIAFSPDGTQLVVSAEAESLHVWDLRAIGEELAERGLGWALPPYPPEQPSASYDPIRVAVDLGTQGFPGSSPFLRGAIARYSAVLALSPLRADFYFRRGLAHAELGEWPQARADCDRALLLDPAWTPAYYLRGRACERLGDNRQALDDFAAAARREPHRTLPLAELQTALDSTEDNDQAWGSLTGPAEQQLPGLATLLVERAVLLAPDNGLYWNTLGLAHYRLGRWQLAVDTLQHSLDVNHGRAAAYDLFFLAMSHARLGHRDQARACYDQANAWWKAQKSLPGNSVAELTVFRKEAAALLR